MPHVPQPGGEEERQGRSLAEQEEAAGTPQRQRLAPKKFDMRSSNVPVADVYRQLFGREPGVDERTGELVHNPLPGTQPPAFPANVTP